MNLWDIVKTVGTTAANVFAPGVVTAVNAFLPDDKKLPDTATGNDIKSAVESLPPEQQAALMEKQFDVDITQIKESHSTVRSMLESDAKNPHSTRPYIAKGAFNVVAFSTITAITMWAVGVATNNKTIVDAVTDGWPFVVAVNAPLVTLLLAYFGTLKKEHKDRLDAANGAAHPPGIAGLLSNFVRRK